jgi:diguanylate cyclase (GGDEF)-like protein
MNVDAKEGKDGKKLSVQEKIAKLRLAFIKQLPERIREAQRLLRLLHANPHALETTQNLHRIFHSLKGTGRSFGFPELGDLAAEGEDLVSEPCIHTANQEISAASTSVSTSASTSASTSVSTSASTSVSSSASTALSQKLQRIGELIEQISHQADLINANMGKHSSPNSVGFAMPNTQANKANKTDKADQVETHPVSGCGRLIYLCDDDTALLDQLAAQLACFGYETISFSDPEELSQTIMRRWPDALIMDISFPHGHDAGPEIVKAIVRQANRSMPTIFLSARDDFNARLASVQAGGEAYFTKPTRATELVAVLDDLTCQQDPEPYRILIVDDEPEIADYHAIILQEAGMMTHQVSEARQLLHVLQDFRPDMVLMDMYMPTCNGRDLAKLVRQVPDYVGLPIVFLSSETDKQKQFSAMRIGAEGFLTKPVVPAELVAAVMIRAERMRTLRSLMARDSLTGLFNHSTTTQLLENAIANTRRTNIPLCFAMIDIDRFKLINDTYGHPAGDQVIIAIARVLQQRLRNSDIVGRYGGEEFAVILQDVSTDEAFRLIDQLREDFSQVLFHAGDMEFSCTFSAGIASSPKYRRIEHLREAADKALYEAKNNGRNCVVVD